MATTYEPIATTTLGSTQSSVTFSTISSTYTDLVLVGSAKNTSVGMKDVNMRLNSDSGANYSTTRLYGSGTTIGSDRQTGSSSMYAMGYPGGSSTPSIFAPFILDIMNYSNSTTYKSVVCKWGSTGTSDQYVLTSAGLWRSTSAISSIELFTNTDSFAIGSTFTLYGIKAA